VAVGRPVVAGKERKRVASYIHKCIHGHDRTHPGGAVEVRRPSRESARHQPKPAIVRALEQAARQRSGWAPEFLNRLRQVDAETSAAVDDLFVAVKHARRSKTPRDL
jgi:hypothetical protein